METKRKLHDMGAIPLLDAIAAQDDDLAIGMSFEQRISLMSTKPIHHLLITRLKDLSVELDYDTQKQT